LARRNSKKTVIKRSTLYFQPLLNFETPLSNSAMALFHLQTAFHSAKLPLHSGVMHFCRAETTIWLLPAVIAPCWDTISKPFAVTAKPFGATDKPFETTGKGFGTTPKPLRTTAKGFETMPKGFGDR
jgi:hypothetical protein